MVITCVNHGPELIFRPHLHHWLSRVCVMVIQYRCIRFGWKCVFVVSRRIVPCLKSGAKWKTVSCEMRDNEKVVDCWSFRNMIVVEIWMSNFVVETTFVYFSTLSQIFDLSCYEKFNKNCKLPIHYTTKDCIYTLITHMSFTRNNYASNISRIYNLLVILWKQICLIVRFIENVFVLQ